MPKSSILDGLAAAWEDVSNVRRGARETGHLVRWPTPETVGIPSMHHVCRNRHPLACALSLANLLGAYSHVVCLRNALVLNTNTLNVLATMWVHRYDYQTTQKAKTPPLAAIHEEATRII